MSLTEKKQFRKEMLGRRDLLSSEKRNVWDEERNRLIQGMKEYEGAKLLLFYVSYRSEADTRYLLRQALKAGRDIAVPKVEGTELLFYRIIDMTQLVSGYRGILEPDVGRAKLISEAELQEYVAGQAILFVPGCAFDRRGGRMGYGGGFYDRFISRYPNLLKVAFSYEEQIVERVPAQEHDRRVDLIITEKEIIRAGKI